MLDAAVHRHARRYLLEVPAVDTREGGNWRRSRQYFVAIQQLRRFSYVLEG